MPNTPKGLSDEKAARMMAALREGRTLRTFGVKPAKLEAYFDVRPEYAQEARPLIEANMKAAFLRKGAYLREKTHCVNGHLLVEHVRVAMHKGWIRTSITLWSMSRGTATAGHRSDVGERSKATPFESRTTTITASLN
jgi:hypothetical protein